MSAESQATPPPPRLSGMRGFLLVWLGQIISILASGMTGFALTLWVYQKTGSATAMGAMQVAYILPFLLMSPLAGALVDRHSRKLMMAVSDVVAAAGTLGVLLLAAADQLQLWHLYAAAALNGLGNTFQWPAYSAAISVMVPKEQYARVDGLMSLMESGPGVLAPILAGFLMPILGLTGILGVDLLTFALALTALSLVFIPKPPRSAAGAQAEAAREKHGLLAEATYGFAFILKRPGLLGLQLVFLGVNLFSGFSNTLVAPLILARTESSPVALASVFSAMALGAVGGGLVMGAWGGFKRRVDGVAVGCLIMALSGGVVFGLGRSVTVWIVAGAITALAGPIANASSQAIWQLRVPPDVQGRVFSARRLISWFTAPLTPLLAGLTADYLAEPLMRGAGAPAGLVAVFGRGPGAGMAIIVVVAGLIGSVVALLPWLLPVVRTLESTVDPVESAPPEEARPRAARSRHHKPSPISSKPFGEQPVPSRRRGSSTRRTGISPRCSARPARPSGPRSSPSWERPSAAASRRSSSAWPMSASHPRLLSVLHDTSPRMSRGTSPWDRVHAISGPSPRTDRGPATAPRRALLRGDLPDSFTRSLYRLSPYRGCAHGCRYCDGRAEKYYVTDDFERDIIIRDDLPDRFARELPGLREDGMIAIGSGTTDAYQPCEANAGVTRRCAEALVAHAEDPPARGSHPQLPVLMMTKSALALRDLPLWRRINAASGFLLLVSLTSLDEELRAVMEPGASSFAERLELLSAYKESGCPVGVLAMPLLPGLSDETASIRRLFEACAGIGVDFIMPGGLTLRPGRQKELYLETLAGYRPDLLESTCTLYREERASGMPLRSALTTLQESIAPIRHEFRIPWLLPHAIHARLLPPWDSFHILLLDMAELYAERGNDTGALRKATRRYDEWLLGLRRYFRRRRNLPTTWLPERFAEALGSGELHRVLENDRMAHFADAVLRHGSRLDYGNLVLSRPEKGKPMEPA